MVTSFRDLAAETAEVACASRTNRETLPDPDHLGRAWLRWKCGVFPVFRASTVALCLNVWNQAGIKIAGTNISNLRYADDTTLMAESEE